MSHRPQILWRPVCDRLGQMRPLDLIFLGTGVAAILAALAELW
jgi:hypothetical protein